MKHTGNVALITFKMGHILQYDVPAIGQYRPITSADLYIVQAVTEIVSDVTSPENTSY